MFVDSVERNKHVFKLLSPSGVATPFFFLTKPHDKVPTGNGDPVTGDVECRWGRMDAAGLQTTNAMVDRALYRTYRHASVNLFITTNMDDHDEEKRREQNLIVGSGKSEAEVTSNRRRIVLLKLTTL